MRQFATVLLLALAAPVAAQQVSPPAGAVAPLAYMIGKWEGPAWIDMGPGGRHELTQREWVSTAAGGNVLTIVGQGTEKMADGSLRLAHDAYAVMYRDRDGKIAFRAFRGDGNWLDPELVMGEHGFVWSFTDPRGGRIRYTMTHTAQDEWNEVGEREAGGTWVKFYEMTLRRVP